VALAPVGEHFVDQFGWVLQISRNDRHGVPGGMGQSRRDRRRRTEVPRQLDDSHPAFSVLQRIENRERIVLGTVVDEYEFELVDPVAIGQSLKPLEQVGQTAGVVVHRHDD
jgi:hypothetical protein